MLTVIFESVIHTPEVTVAAITGLLSLTGVILSNVSANRKIEHKLETAQAVTDTKIEQLTEEVRKHNNFAEKIPVLDQRISAMEHKFDKMER